MDEKGLPLSIVLSGANVHDVKLLDETLRTIVIEKPEDIVQNLCLDAGYVGTEEMIKKYGYIAHIRPRGEEKKEIEHNPNFKARRWVVEVAHSWLNRFRKLLVRYEKKAVSYLSLVYFACAIIVWRKIIPVHQ
ncbi:MAG: IS5 family transposase [Thermotogae bacterium]|nr:IS5 family transposase [Thermotogota bacterium]